MQRMVTQPADLCMSACDYADYVRQVPQLMSSFTHKFKKSLMATSKFTQMQQHITAVRIKKEHCVHRHEAVQLLVQQDYPHIRSLILSGIFLGTDDVAELCQGTGPLLETLDLSCNNSSYTSEDLDLSPLWDLDCPMLQTLDVASDTLSCSSQLQLGTATERQQNGLRQAGRAGVC